MINTFECYGIARTTRTQFTVWVDIDLPLGDRVAIRKRLRELVPGFTHCRWVGVR